MANPNLTVSVDEYLKDTRVRTCRNEDCKFNMIHGDDLYERSFNCKLKAIYIGRDGQCGCFEPYPRLTDEVR